MVLCRIMKTWVVVTLITLLTGVHARFHPSHNSSDDCTNDNPLGLHWDWKLPLSNGMHTFSVIILRTYTFLSTVATALQHQTFQ